MRARSCGLRAASAPLQSCRARSFSTTASGPVVRASSRRRACPKPQPRSTGSVADRAGAGPTAIGSKRAAAVSGLCGAAGGESLFRAARTAAVSRSGPPAPSIRSVRPSGRRASTSKDMPLTVPGKGRKRGAAPGVMGACSGGQRAGAPPQYRPCPGERAHSVAGVPLP